MPCPGKYIYTFSPFMIDMSAYSRRTVLALGGGALAGLAGCLGPESDGDTTVDVNPTPHNGGGGGDTDRTPDMGNGDLATPDADIELTSTPTEDGDGHDITITAESMTAEEVLVHTRESTYTLTTVGETVTIVDYQGTLHIEASDGETREFIMTYETEDLPPDNRQNGPEP